MPADLEVLRATYREAMTDPYDCHDAYVAAEPFIAALEAEVERLQGDVDALRYVDYVAQISELQAKVAKLRGLLGYRQEPWEGIDRAR